MSAQAKSVSVKVSYGDVALASAKGGKVLFSWISRAAIKACTDGSRLALGVTETCRREAIANAVRRADIPVLTAAWVARGGDPVRMAAR